MANIETMNIIKNEAGAEVGAETRDGEFKLVKAISFIPSVMEKLVAGQAVQIQFDEHGKPIPNLLSV